jgi:hypothetical protein
VCLTLDRTLTVVAAFDEEAEGECDIIPAPSLLADPSMPRQSRGRAAESVMNGFATDSQVGGRGETFLRLLPDACTMV